MHPDAPWLEYGFEEPYTALEFQLPMPPWAVADESPGGWDISAGDVDEAFDFERVQYSAGSLDDAFEITYRHIRELRLPFRESQ